MTIKANLEKAASAIGRDIDNGNPLELARRVGEAAVDAITGGINSVKWERYMALFCDTKNELAQMTVVRGTDKSYMSQMRAYTPANAVCFGETRTAVANGITKDIEPSAEAIVPAGTKEPSLVRDEELATDLRAE